MEELGAAEPLLRRLHHRYAEPTVTAFLGRYGLLEAPLTWG
jgi:hypothetical protein